MNSDQETPTPFNPQMSLYIPRIQRAWADQAAFATIFHNQHIGCILQVDFREIKNNTQSPYIQAFVHFVNWYDNIITRNLQVRITNPEKQARLVYMDPWFWELRENFKTPSNVHKMCLQIEKLKYQVDYLYSNLERSQTLIGHYADTINTLTDKNVALEIELEINHLAEDDATKKNNKKKINKKSKSCDNCHEIGRVKYCLGCKEARFCSKECQQEAWRVGGGHTKRMCQELQKEDKYAFLPIGLAENEGPPADEFTNNFYHRHNSRVLNTLENDFEPDRLF